jgi:hypothetical protein
VQLGISIKTNTADYGRVLMKINKNNTRKWCGFLACEHWGLFATCEFFSPFISNLVPDRPRKPLLCTLMECCHRAFCGLFLNHFDAANKWDDKSGKQMGLLRTPGLGKMKPQQMFYIWTLIMKQFLQGLLVFYLQNWFKQISLGKSNHGAWKLD